jgi:hypothetical protein
MKKKRESLFNWSRSIITDPKIFEDLFLSFLSQLLVLLLFNYILTFLGIPIPIPIIIVATCEFEEDKVDSMELIYSHSEPLGSPGIRTPSPRCRKFLSHYH